MNNGARLYVVDPRRTGSAEWADGWLGLDVGSDIALANAVGREIIAAGLENREFIDRATSGFEGYKAKVESYTLEYAEQETGVPADLIRELAHAYAKADKAMICWTLGITEHHNAVDNVISLINLAVLTGHVGKYGSGLNPLRGQNNVQGGGDMGALPDRLPGFQHVENDALRARFDEVWGVPVPPKRGWHLSGMFDAMERGDLTAVYVIGENPIQSEADQHRTIKLMNDLEFLVVQDMFLTKTAAIADVVLPAAAGWAESEGTVTNSERRVQRVRKALEPPGEARDDLWIVYELARRMGHDWGEASAEKTWNELRTLSPVHAGMSYKRLEELGGLQWPCYDENHPGELFLHSRLVGGPGAGQPRPAHRHGPRSAHRQALARLPDPAHDRPAARLVQHRRADRRLHVAAAAGRVARHVAGGRGVVRAGARRTRPGHLPPRPDRGPDPHRRVIETGSHVHDAALPGRRRDEPADDRRHGPEVRHGRIQGHGHPHREAGGIARIARFAPA